VTDDGLQRAWAGAPSERATEVGWEPADWDAVLRRRRRAQWSQAGVLLLLAVVIGPLVRFLMDRPTRVSWVWLGLALVVAGVAWWSQFTRRGRAAWLEEAGQEIRIEHALRHHVSIGAADRELVTARAEKIARWAWAALIGWPLLVALCATILVISADGIAARIAFGLVGVLVCGGLVRAERRRMRWAQRWLADPPGGDEHTPRT
jgi:hypothetical protein